MSRYWCAISGAISVWVMTAAGTAVADPWRVRLTETSVTETGRLVADRINLQTKGYGLGVTMPSGFGGALTSLTTRGSEQIESVTESIELQHRHLDASYTYGESWLITGGFGVSVGGRAAVRGQESSKLRGSSLFLGPGYSFKWFEVYWIYRQNRLRYEFANGASRIAALQHFQLGLGVNF